MSSLTGKVATAAATPATTWGTAVAVGALDGVLIASESFSKTPEMLEDMPISTDFKRNIIAGNITVEGSLSGDFRYESWDQFLAIVMGADTVVQPDATNSPSVYDHTYDLVGDVLGNLMTIVFDKVTRIHELTTVALTGFTISGDAGGVLTIEVTGLAYDRITNSVVNTSTEISAVTYQTRGLTIPFNIGTFRVNVASAGALGAGDIVCPNSFSLSAEIPLEGDQVACGGQQVTQPDYTGIPSYKLSLEFPRVLATLPAFVDLLQAETEMKSDIQYIGPVINSADTTPLNHTWTVEMPRMKIMNADELIEGVGKIPVSAEFELLEAASAPTGMSVTKPMQQVMRNGDSRDFAV